MNKRTKMAALRLSDGLGPGFAHGTETGDAPKCPNRCDKPETTFLPPPNDTTGLPVVATTKTGCALYSAAKPGAPAVDGFAALRIVFQPSLQPASLFQNKTCEAHLFSRLLRSAKAWLSPDPDMRRTDWRRKRAVLKPRHPETDWFANRTSVTADQRLHRSEINKTLQTPRTKPPSGCVPRLETPPAFRCPNRPTALESRSPTLSRPHFDIDQHVELTHTPQHNH
ncbi:hypothetical protein L0152_31405, partial [bacterium]|nr:hypothetical protein [bacterium]